VACGFRFLARPAGRRKKQDAPGNRDQLELRVLIVVAHVVHAAATVLTKWPVTPALAVALAIALIVLTEAAVTPARAVPVLAILTEVPMTPALAVLTAVIHSVTVFVRPKDARQHREAGFLRIVEALVQRSSGISDLLQRCATLGHVVRPA
jgi:hypothetical protein